MQYVCGFNKDGKFLAGCVYKDKSSMERPQSLNQEVVLTTLETEETFNLYAKGYIYQNGVPVPAPTPIIPLEEAKAEKLTEVDQWTASKITGGFVSTCYNGENILYDTDTETQLTMTKARANCEGERFAQAFPNGMGVRGYAQTGTDADGTMVFANTKTVYNFLPEHIIAWDEDFSLHLAKCKYEGWIMQDKVNNATTKEELESIVLE